MKREDVTRERLLEVLNEKLHKLEACQDCEFRKPPHRLRKPDADGCNWSEFVDVGRCRGCDPNLLAGVISWARQRYNLLSRPD